MTEAEMRMQRYRQVEREADALGRVIGVRRLRPSERGKLQAMTSDLNGYEEVENSDGEKVQVHHRTPYFIAASVCEIDGAPIPFPKNRPELDAILDRLDREGVEAASNAFQRLGGIAGAASEPIDEAKKS